MSARRHTHGFSCGCLLAATVLSIILGIGLTVASGRSIDVSLAGLLRPRVTPWTETRPVTFLFLGTDQRPDKVEPSRSDSIMLGLFEPTAKRAVLLSIPRDLWVTIPGHGEGRINTAFFLGQVYDVPNGGPGLAMLTVEYNFGVPVDYWATINFRGFESVIDAMGGVTVEVPYDIYDPEYPDDSNGTMILEIPAGSQHFTGAEALRYARTRHGDSDFDRAARQQQIVRAALDQALTPGGLVRLPRVAATLQDTLSTNTGAGTAASLAAWLGQRGELTLDTFIVDRSLAADYVTASGAQVLLPDWPGIHALVAQQFAARLPQGLGLQGTSVAVYNATELPGLASTTAAFLTTQGAAAIAQGDNPGGLSEVSTLVMHADAPEAEAYLRSLYGLDDSQVTRSEGDGSGTTCTLVLGWDVIAGE